MRSAVNSVSAAMVLTAWMAVMRWGVTTSVFSPMLTVIGLSAWRWLNSIASAAIMSSFWFFIMIPPVV